MILRISGTRIEGVIDEIAAEAPILLMVNDKPLVTLQCTPSEIEELAVGFLLTEGLLRERSALGKLEFIETDSTIRVELSDLPADWGTIIEKRTVTSGCGKGITFSAFTPEGGRNTGPKPRLLTLDDIRRLLAEFRTISQLYLETGGVHSAALSDGREILFFSEDIGRHNAVDKLIGKAFLQSVPVENKILLTSGRVTSEIMLKAAKNRFPVLISRAAPSCMAISYAEDMGITLIGFARGDRMNVYSWPNRIMME